VVLRAVRHPPAPGASRALRTALIGALTAILLLVPVVGLAHADTFDDIYKDYRRTQRIDPCKYTTEELRDARSKIGSDSDQYAPEFPDALDEAIAASGDCKAASSSSSGTTGSSGSNGTTTSAGPTTTAPTTTQATTTVSPTTTTTATVVPVPTTPGPAAVTQPAAAAQDGVIAARAETPTDPGPEGWTWAVLAAAIVAAAALGWAFVNATGRVAWLTPLGHSMGEAGWRISLRWAEFRDWLRFGSGR
jgi:cell division septation protein DedD